MVIRVDMDEVRRQQRDAQRASDLKMIEAATPALRSILAFCIYLRFGTSLCPLEDVGSITHTELSQASIDKAYEEADMFVDKLKGDYQS